MTHRHKMRKCCRKNGIGKLTQCRVATNHQFIITQNLQSMINYNKTGYACICISNPAIYIKKKHHKQSGFIRGRQVFFNIFFTCYMFFYFTKKLRFGFLKTVKIEKSLAIPIPKKRVLE